MYQYVFRGTIPDAGISEERTDDSATSAETGCVDFVDARMARTGEVLHPTFRVDVFSG
jgi:hypothetical protein